VGSGGAIPALNWGVQLVPSARSHPSCRVAWAQRQKSGHALWQPFSALKSEPDALRTTLRNTTRSARPHARPRDVPLGQAASAALLLLFICPTDPNALHAPTPRPSLRPDGAVTTTPRPRHDHATTTPRQRHDHAMTMPRQRLTCSWWL